MLGGLIKIAGQMAAFSASHTATMGAARWLSSRVRQAVDVYATYGAQSTRLGTRIARNVMERVTGYSNPAAHADLLRNLVPNVTSIARSNYVKFLRRFNRPGRKTAAFLKNAVRDELLTLPANYVQYRLEKHRAVSPEERESVSSFRKYYLGTPMAVSVAINYAQERMSGGKLIRAASTKLARKLGAHRVKASLGPFMTKGGSSTEALTLAGRAQQAITEKLGRIARAKFVALEGRTAVSMVGMIGPMALSRRIWDAYKNETVQVAGGARSQFIDRVWRDHQSLNATFQQMVKSRVTEKNMTEVQGTEFLKLMSTKIDEVTKARVNKFTEKAVTKNRFVAGWNHMVKQLGDPSAFLRAETMAVDESLGKVLGDKASVPTGRYLMGGSLDKKTGTISGGTTIDFGALSLTRLKDMALGLATKGVIGKGLHLFGLKNIIEARDSEHSAVGAATITRREPLYFPMAHFSESGEYTARDVIAQMGGFHDYNSIKSDITRERANDFLDSRLNAISSEYGIAGKDRESLERAFMASARHGELMMQAGDMIVQMPGGRVKVITMHQKDDMMQPLEFDVGGHDGKLLEFHKFTREHGSSVARVIRSFTGYEQAVYKTAAGGTVTVTHGPGKLGKVMDVMGAEEQRGIWYKLKTLLDIGYSQDQSIFSKIASIFRKHTDPRYPTTFFSDQYLGSKEFRENILKTERSKEDLVKFFRDNADKQMLEFYTGLVRRTGGTDDAIRIFKELGQKNREYGISGITQNLLSGKSSVDDARNTLESLIGKLKTTETSPGVKPSLVSRHFLQKDIEELEEIRKMFTAPTGKTVLDVMGHISARRGSTVVGGKWVSPNRLDEYNAMVLRIETGLYQSGTLPVPDTGAMSDVMRNLGAIPKPITNAERSAWYAASHMAREYHGLAAAISESTVESLSEGANQRIKSILEGMANVSGSMHNDITRYYRKRRRFSAWSIWDTDSRLKWEDTQNVKTGIYLVPKGVSHGFVSKEPVNLTNEDQISIARGVMDAANISVMAMFHGFNRAASQMLGIGFDETTLSTPFQYFEKMLFNRVLPFTAVYLGYSVLDRVTDRLMDGTPFGEGLTTFGANVLAGARVAAQGFLDVTGVTGISARLEDLMPGIITSPMSGAVRGVGPIAAGMSIGMRTLGPKGALTGGLIGSAVGVLAGGGPLGVFGMWDISKTRAETVQELLGEKEVAIRKGRWWELSGSPFEGTRVQYYRPHVYSLLRSDYKETPGFKDSLFTEVVGHIAPDWYAMKNYYSRPYPVTAGLFSNLPVFGNMLDLLSSTTRIGRLSTLRGIPMHRGEQSPLYLQRMGEESGLSVGEVANDIVQREGYFSQTAGSAGTSTLGAMVSSYQGRSPIQPGNQVNYTANPMMRSSFEWGLGETVENIKDIVGLRGFLMGTAFGELTGRNSLFDYAPQLASPVEIPGIQREYWDYELGGILGASEIIRRYINPKRGNVDIYNPIRNTMPPWLPGYNYYIDFQHGDPYTMVPMGEARLPGAAYETLHDVDLTMPIVSDILGETVDTQAAYYLGIPNFMAARNNAMDVAKEVAISYREDAKRYGELLSEERTVYNVFLDASATVDAIISQRKKGSQVPVKIVPKGFAGVSNLNAFLVMSEADTGILVEVNPETGGITERTVKRDIKRFTNDIKAATSARLLAYNQVARMEEAGKAFNLANSYSWFDRYRILADVAHYSQEFKEARAIVRKQIAAGKLPPEKLSEFELIEEQVDNKKKAYEFREYRFKDLGQGLTPYTKARDRFVEEEYNFLEKTVGGMWERITHIRNPLQTKFYHNLDAMEEYERNAIYGKTLKMWQNPVEDWLVSYAQTALGEHDPVQASVNWATAGFLIGGGPLASLAAGLGGTLTGITNLWDDPYIPGRTLETRDIVAQADAVKYAKYMKLYQETGDEEYLSLANRTLTGKSLEGDSLTARKIGRALGRPERDYVEDIVNNVTRANIDRVSQILPAPAVASIYHTIGERPYAEDMMRQYSRAQKERYIPGLESPIYDRNVPIESPIISTFEQAGLNAHDAGYGWYSQMAQIERLRSLGTYSGETLYPGFESRVSVKRFEKSLDSTNRLRQSLMRFGTNVQIINDGADRVEVELIVR